MDTTLVKFHMEVDCAEYLKTAASEGCSDAACCLNEISARLEGYGAKHVEATIDGTGIKCTFYLPLDNAKNLHYIQGVRCFFRIDG